MIQPLDWLILYSTKKLLIGTNIRVWHPVVFDNEIITISNISKIINALKAKKFEEKKKLVRTKMQLASWN